MTKTHKLQIQNLELSFVFCDRWKPYRWNWDDFGYSRLRPPTRERRPKGPNDQVNKYAKKFRKRHGLSMEP